MLRRRTYLEDIRHRELPLGQEAAVNMHLNTVKTLEGYAKRENNHRKYKDAIEAHKKALKLYRGLKDGKGLVRQIRAAKKAGKEAHIITRKLG